MGTITQKEEFIMGLITDIIKGLPISAVQDEKIKQLEKHLVSLETENSELKDRLARYEEQPGEKCPACRKPTFTLTSSKPNADLGDLGLTDYLFTCSSCNFSDGVTADSAGKAWKKTRGH